MKCNNILEVTPVIYPKLVEVMKFFDSEDVDQHLHRVQ